MPSIALLNKEGGFNPSRVEKPLIPPPFNSTFFPNQAFHSPVMFPLHDDVYFRFMAVRNKKDHYGVLSFDTLIYPNSIKEMVLMERQGTLKPLRMASIISPTR